MVYGVDGPRRYFFNFLNLFVFLYVFLIKIANNIVKKIKIIHELLKITLFCRNFSYGVDGPLYESLQTR